MADSVRLKLVIDTKENRLLYAEYGLDFAELVAKVLSLPLTIVTGLRSGQNTQCCLGDLYESLDNLHYKLTDSFRSNKDALLSLKHTGCSCMMPYESLLVAKLLQRCNQCEGLIFCNSENKLISARGAFMVMDDLVVKPLLTASVMSLFINSNIKDVAGAIEEREVHFGFNETVLTDLFLIREKVVKSEVTDPPAA
ncbi:hypothetical protein COLO4_10935 [Corchorus olitorius]|uniref:Uncharacterized protein n=1 Tax=Corchorus olitorius TaxID=93759 RepID=A0A1R3K6H0_9ROSI|nr:hypothetical protein COLO4_10935 [Corchorus olitorius]